MLYEGLRVKAISGKNKDKVGTILGCIPMSQVQNLENGKDISMEGAIKLWLVEFEDEEQDILTENELDVVQ